MSDEFIGASPSPHPFDGLKTSLKLTRTITDLTVSEYIQYPYLNNVFQYRTKLMQNTILWNERVLQ